MILYARYKKGQKKSAMRALARSGLFSYIVPQKYGTLKLRTRERIRRSGVAKIRSMGEGPEEEAPLIRVTEGFTDGGRRDPSTREIHAFADTARSRVQTSRMYEELFPYS
ncbi:MAG: hypothetical protein MPJ06_03780 [Nitrosopumilus sp.]|nr:hypothetical protein [Nitrosopumilus sp.]MDA7943109.1 hypothetical protein [Nitrosopumilus sp.]